MNNFEHKYTELLKQKNNIELQLKEFNNNYDVSLELIEKSSDSNELLQKILDEYLNRLEDFEGINITELNDSDVSTEKKEKLKSLIMFATQATILHERAKFYKKLDLKNKELKQLNEHYLNMLSFVSHELRSPLISILGYAELLSDKILGELNIEQNDALKIIIKVTNNLMDMIKNYLDLTRIETGQMKIHITKQSTFIISEVIYVVLHEMKEQFKSKNMHIPDYDYPDIRINIDKKLMRIVITNLFSNAIRYGKKDTEILYESSFTNNIYQFGIKNFGTGVKDEKINSIFNKFTQAPESSQNIDTQKGTGLGLFIAKTIIEEHGGKIWAETKYGEWFQIYFQLPRDSYDIVKTKENFNKPIDQLNQKNLLSFSV